MLYALNHKQNIVDKRRMNKTIYACPGDAIQLTFDLDGFKHTEYIPILPNKCDMPLHHLDLLKYHNVVCNFNNREGKSFSKNVKSLQNNLLKRIRL